MSEPTALAKRIMDAREAAGLPRLIDDEQTLRMIAAVIASGEERERRAS
jgi:hypothetical protein